MVSLPTEECCAEAVRVALTSGLPRKQVAADFGIGFSTLNRWIQQDRRMMAVVGTLIGGAILFFFAFLGDFVLTKLGISQAALRTAGGILLLLMAIDMVFARYSGGTSTTDEEEEEASGRSDISIFSRWRRY